MPEPKSGWLRGVRRLARALREQLGGRLLPTGMHPFMRPDETRLWPRAGKRIYETYARVFLIREHGWLNVQSSQINLPFGNEHETVLLHNAIACILPYLALAASSPFVEARPGPAGRVEPATGQHAYRAYTDGRPRSRDPV